MGVRRAVFTERHFAGLLVLMLAVCGFYCFMKPLVLSVDSVYGFLAYKGSLFFHAFNVVQEISPDNIALITPVFESWWSPGQWLFPALLNCLFGTRLGIASIWITLAALAGGFAGYYRVFRFYGFSSRIILISLLIIFSGSTLYYCFVVYQGGEVLEFGFFPWFLLYVIKIRQVTWRKLLVVTLLFLLCFTAKTTLLLYCSFVLLAQWIQMNKTTFRNPLRFPSRQLGLLLPALICVPLIWLLFLSKGPHPVVVGHFGFSPEAILVPLSSPLNSILSIQQYINRGELAFVRFFPAANANLFSYVLYLLVFVMLLWFLGQIRRNKKIDPNYKIQFFILYGGLLTFFLLAYVFNANIDLSSRHFKLMGYLLVPGLVYVLEEKFRPSGVNAFLVLVCVISLLDIFYLKRKWARGRDISIQYFYRNCEPPEVSDKLDRASYEKLITIERVAQTGKPLPAVFWVESTPDIGIDLKYPAICQAPSRNIHADVYRKSGVRLFVCVSKGTLSNNPGLLKWKFPDYADFALIDETDQYWFFMGK